MSQLQISDSRGSDTISLPTSFTRHRASSSGYLRLGGLLPWQTQRVREYVESGLDGRPSIKGAAEQAKLSPSYFSRRFRQSFGMTFSQFVARRRVARAQSMMIRSRSSLCQIALACGFTDQAHFTRTFGGLIGSTPSAWRRLAAQPIEQSHVTAAC
ncbi:helix-turn-helix domain-containing protein [Caulobacter segnis]|uniref:AraC family transcriptional regulator n=1 Tax=Caulobacter segnis TaxID=88688 RepID=A0A2W5WRE3_9CAUL|nr:AraC family transcriptional regulator [Caulobacter segnis]PZR30464.1 MAG: AraC family transcriptional regulator [Caulobacter segnis]